MAVTRDDIDLSVGDHFGGMATVDCRRDLVQSTVNDSHRTPDVTRFERSWLALDDHVLGVADYALCERFTHGTR